ncbi:protein of unknown function [Legionella hackeliae]|uniref:Uncharacterized protein n=1 Tax=Legionella hackeliae TaxID=449 RepID=A0A0A8UQ97_LEGHA|nr:protein of unknown function [Legionella hackeliae]
MDTTDFEAGHEVLKKSNPKDGAVNCTGFLLLIRGAP